MSLLFVFLIVILTNESTQRGDFYIIYYGLVENI